MGKKLPSISNICLEIKHNKPSIHGKNRDQFAHDWRRKLPVRNEPHYPFRAKDSDLKITKASQGYATPHWDILWLIVN